MDFAMPRAHDLPMFKDEVHIVPATTNPLGVKGAARPAPPRRSRR